MLEIIVDPWNYEFMWYAIAIGILVGILCPIVGSYLIVVSSCLFIIALLFSPSQSILTRRT
jgi:manganese/iron transport system permease protein